jgi:ABC-2 type transport system permease protein
MTRALAWKQLHDCRGLLLCSALLLFGFHWLLVWVTSLLDLEVLRHFLRLTEWITAFLPIPLDQFATPRGLIASAYMDPAVLFIVGVWCIARGSDSISGELDRGTMELLLAQPIRRGVYLLVHAAVTVAGGAVLAVACWLGTATGLATVPRVGDEVAAWWLVPAALNLFCLAFFLCGLSTLVSSWHRYRWHAISWVGAFFLVELILKVVSRMTPKLDWFRYLTFFGAYEPAVLVVEASPDSHLALQYNGLLLGLGLACYVGGFVALQRRDLPAPL